MGSISPPSAARVESDVLRGWHGVFSPPWELLVGLGYVEGASGMPFNNSIADLAAADGQVMVYGDATLEPELQPTLITTAGTFYIASNNAGDTMGAEVHYIDAAGDRQMDEVTLVGTTPVKVGGTLDVLHVNMVALEGLTKNLGLVTISTKSDVGLPLVITDNIQVAVSVGDMFGHNPTMKCPNDEQWVIGSLHMAADKNDGVTVGLYKYLINDSGVLSEHKIHTFTIYEASYQHHFEIPQSIKEGEAFRLTCSRSAAGNGSVNLEVNLDLIRLDGTQGVSGEAGVASLFETSR